MDINSDVKMVVYHDEYPVALCKPEHLGFMGVYFKNIYLGYPVGTRLDVGFFGHDIHDVEEDRVPMIVNKTDFDGTGLRLQSFENENIQKWNSLRSLITHGLDNTSYQRIQNAQLA